MARNGRDRGHPVLAAVAEQLRIEAARQRLTVRELARRSGVPYPTTQKSLAGARMIDVVELTKLCQALGVTPGQLLTDAAIDGTRHHPRKGAP